MALIPIRHTVTTVNKADLGRVGDIKNPIKSSNILSPIFLSDAMDFLVMSAPAPKRVRWEIVPPPLGPRMYIDVETGHRMKRTARKRVKVGPIVPFVLPEDPFKRIPDGDPDEKIEEDLEEYPEEDPEEDPKEEPNEASRSGSNSWPLDYTAPDGETESDLDSTIRSGAKAEGLEDTCESNAIIPQIVTRVTNNVNNANGTGGNANGGTEMVVTITGALIRNFWHVSQETLMEKETRGRDPGLGMTWEDFKALFVEEFCPSNEMEKLESEF
ncbi:hypothetical protein Tco_0572583 [Tanacetum coccineum]